MLHNEIFHGGKSFSRNWYIKIINFFISFKVVKQLSKEIYDIYDSFEQPITKNWRLLRSQLSETVFYPN